MRIRNQLPSPPRKREVQLPCRCDRRRKLDSRFRGNDEGGLAALRQLPNAAALGRCALRCPAASSACLSPPTIRPRIPPGSRKRTSVLAGWTLTSTSSAGTLDEKRQDRVAVAREQILIGAAHRADQQPVLHRAAVDEEILMIGDAAVEGRQAGDAAEPHALALHNPPRRCSRARSRLVSAATRAGPVLAGRHGERPPAVMLEREADIGPRHGEPLHDIDAGGIFAALGAQELAPRRHLREQIARR